MAVLVIDIGSSSVRALLCDEDAAPIPGAAASIPHHPYTQAPGEATYDPLEIRARVESCIDAVMQHPAAARISVVGMATLASNLLGLDHNSQPVTPLYSYADTRCAADVAVLRATLPVESIHQRTGCLIHTAYHPARLRWLWRTQPDLFRQVDQWTDIGTYLYTAWFGDAPCSYSIASWSGLLSRSSLDWYTILLSELRLEEIGLPPLADYGDCVQGLLPDYAGRWPALREVPFCLAVGDGAAATIGCGCTDSSRIALTLGTTAALRVVSDDILPSVPEGLWSYLIDARNHLIGGATSEGGNLYEWARQTFRLGDDPAELDAALLGRMPDEHGLTVLPLLAGERSPGWSLDATGTITGLRLSTTPTDILQALMEAVALRLALVAKQLGPLVRADAPVIGGGGALAASAIWPAILASALDRVVYLTDLQEVTARGIAVLALRAQGMMTLAASPPPVTTVFEPDALAVRAFQAARERQTALYRQMFGG